MIHSKLPSVGSYVFTGSSAGIALQVGNYTFSASPRKANLTVARTLFEMATSGKHPAATFFWLKTRAGWREADRPEPVRQDVGVDLSNMSDEELEAELAALRRKFEAADRCKAVVEPVPRLPGKDGH